MNTDNLLDFLSDERPDKPIVPHVLWYYAVTFAVLCIVELGLYFLESPVEVFGILGLIILVIGRYYNLSRYLNQNKPKNQRETALTIAKWNGGFSIGIVVGINVLFMCSVHGINDIFIAFPMGLLGGLFAFFLEIVCTMILHTSYISLNQK
jgi:hypothetical protein